MQMVATGAHDHALVVGADVMSSIIDYTDRDDLRALRRRRRRRGAVGRAAGTSRRSSASRTRSTAAAARRCACPPAAAGMPASHETVDQRLHYVKQDGQAVFKFAVRKTEEICRACCSNVTASTPSELDLFVSHQANRRIIKAAAERLGLPESKGRHQPRTLRQHDRGDDSAGARRRRRRQAAEEGRPGAAGLGRRRLHRRRRAPPLEPVTRRPGLRNTNPRAPRAPGMRLYRLRGDTRTDPVASPPHGASAHAKISYLPGRA